MALVNHAHGVPRKKPTPQQWFEHKDYIKLLWWLRKLDPGLLRIIAAYFLMLPRGLGPEFWDKFELGTGSILPVEDWQAYGGVIFPWR